MDDIDRVGSWKLEVAHYERAAGGAARKARLVPQSQGIGATVSAEGIRLKVGERHAAG
jgi:hypothetical protein